VRRTHRLLREALIDSIAEKGFDAVTVGEIAERAMVNRATFYRHYPDKYALVTDIFEEAVDRLISELGPPAENLEALDWMINELGASAEQPLSLQMQHALVAWTTFFEHFAKHAKLYQTMLGKQGSSWFPSQMRSYAASVLHQRLLASHLKAPRKTDDPTALPEEVASMCLANWFVGVLTWWLESGMAASPRQIATWCLRFVVHGYFRAMGF
jgi:AcrR family transcriptional regulator